MNAGDDLLAPEKHRDFSEEQQDDRACEGEVAAQVVVASVDRAEDCDRAEDTANQEDMLRSCAATATESAAQTI